MAILATLGASPVSWSQIAAQNVHFMWSGGATHESIVVKARLSSPRIATLAVSVNPDLADPVVSSPVQASLANDLVATFSVTGLLPDTRYYYTIREINGTLNEPFGSFRTFPAPGCQEPHDFIIAFGSDASTGSNAPTFESIESHDPDLFLLLGDMHYADISTNDATAYRSAYQTALTRPRQASLYRNVSTVYVWDDRDFGPDDSDSTHVGRTAAKSTFVQYVPRHPLESNATDRGVFRAFTLGRTRFIVTDARFHRSPKTDPDNGSKTMLGPIQKDWLKTELLEARDRYPLIVWINPVPWVEMPTAESDRWGGYATERAEIAQFIADNGIEGQLLMLSGDAQMAAVDDGSYAGYASGDRSGGFPVIHASALDRDGAYRGGPYRLGAQPGNMQYGVLTLTDECADRVDAVFEAYDSTGEPVVSSADYNLDEPLTYRHSFFAGGDRLIPRGASWRYRDDGQLPGVGWTSPNFIDTGWDSGPAQLGYGDAPEGESEVEASDVATVLDFGFQPGFKNITYYFRTYFDATDVADIKALVGNVLIDDGAIIYLNGFELARINLPDGIIEPETLADSTVGDAAEARFVPINLSAGTELLFNGTNVLAVEVHQDAQSSPDLSFDMELFAVTSEVAANIRPVAAIDATPLSGQTPLEVTFDASGSDDPDGSIVSYSWDFGDGFSSAQPVIAHTFATEGVFEVTLTVTDNLGRADVAAVQIVVTNAPPEAIILAEPVSGETPLEVTFDGSLSVDPNGTIVSHVWAFGNGDSASGEEVVYVYEQPGTFSAKLAVTDDLGAVGEDSVQLVIAQGNLPPTPVEPLALIISEDTSQINLPLSDYFEDDRDPSGSLTYTVLSVSNETLFEVLVIDTGEDPSISLLPAPNTNGISEFIIRAADSGGLSLTDTLVVTIEPVNDAPRFIAGPDTVIATDAGAVSLVGWATGISPGPIDESEQELEFVLTNPHPELFVTQPQISLDGTLTFEPASDTSGLAEITLRLRDDGGTERGGVDSTPAVFSSIQTNHRPTASFEFVRAEFGSLTVFFDASSSTDRDGTIADFAWDFGDGAAGNGQEVSHTFAEAVPTEVTLTVADDHGTTDTSVASVAVSNESDVLPDEFSVSDFYPNPASASVSLDLALPEPQTISISLIDIMGRTISKSAVEARAGRRSLKIDTSTLPAGSYFARVEAGDDVVILRLAVVR